MITCKVCGSEDVVTQMWHGQCRKRHYCRVHWSEYNNTRARLNYQYKRRLRLSAVLKDLA